MRRATNPPTALVLLLGVAMFPGGCSERAAPDEAATGEERAGPTFAPRLAEFRALEAKGTPAPDEETLANLDELVGVAFSDVGDASLSRRAEARLERHEQRGFAFEDGLKHEDPAVRAQCAWRLGEMGRVAAIPVLFWRLRYEIDNTVRLWMVDALSRLGTDAHVDVLIELLDDGRTAEGAAEVALRLARAAGEEVGDDPSWDDVKELVARIRDRWRATGLPAGRDPIELDPELEARLAGCVADLTEYQLRLVDYARTALTGVGALPLPLLRRSLSAEEFYLRFHSIEVVRDIGRPAASLGDALLPLLDDPPCRVVAMEALGEIGYAPAEAPLRAALADPDPEVRVAAAGALGPLGAPGAVEDLRRILADEGADPDLRVRAAFSLALLEGGGDGLLFLAERRRAEDYHAPTLNELLDRVRSAVDEG